MTGNPSDRPPVRHSPVVLLIVGCGIAGILLLGFALMLFEIARPPEPLGLTALKLLGLAR